MSFSFCKNFFPDSFRQNHSENTTACQPPQDLSRNYCVCSPCLSSQERHRTTWHRDRTCSVDCTISADHIVSNEDVTLWRISSVAHAPWSFEKIAQEQKPTWTFPYLHAVFKWFEVGCAIWAQMSQISVSQIKAPLGSVFQKYVYSSFMIKMRIGLGSFGLFWFILGWG